MSQCFIAEPIEISPEQTTNIVLTVEGLTAADLATDQAICAINIEWEHGLQENLRFELVSPSGQRITLAGPGSQGGGVSPGVNWNVTFVPCSQPTAPDAGISPVWDNAQTWEFLTSYTGSYHPHDGCLDEFMTGSANGDWRLEITTLGVTTGVLIFFEIQFCNDNGVACSFCSVDAGQWQQDDLIFC